MSSRYGPRWPGVVASLVLALALTIFPLPDMLDRFRPDWIALFLIYWTIQAPHQYNIGTAWLCGIVLDVAQGTLLGQHALALAAIIYVTAKFHLLMRVFPLLQLTLTIFALLSAYQFLLFWINGVAGISVEPITYWGPVLTGTLLWPALSMFINGLRFRSRSS